MKKRNEIRIREIEKRLKEIDSSKQVRSALKALGVTNRAAAKHLLGFDMPRERRVCGLILV